MYSRLMLGFVRFYPAKPIYTLIALLLYFPKFGDICAKLRTSYSVQNYAQQNCGVTINQPKTRLIASAQNRAYLTQLKFRVNTSVQNWTHVYLAQNCVQYFRLLKI